MGSLKYFFWITDAGFLIYWFVTYFQLIPAECVYQDYTNPDTDLLSTAMATELPANKD